MAWVALERHIIVFHDRLFSTRRKRIYFHYTPLLLFILYNNIYYVYAIYYYPCQNTYNYALPVCDVFPCYQNDNNMRMWDLFANCIMPSLLEALFSVTFLFRVMWHRYHSPLPFQWRKQRKMTIQLMFFSSLNVAFNVPSNIINIAQQCGAPHDFGVNALQYMYFFCYWVIFLFPFMCLATINGINTVFGKILHLRPQMTLFTATVKPDGTNANIATHTWNGTLRNSFKKMKNNDFLLLLCCVRK